MELRFRSIHLNLLIKRFCFALYVIDPLCSRFYYVVMMLLSIQQQCQYTYSLNDLNYFVFRGVQQSTGISPIDAIIIPDASPLCYNDTIVRYSTLENSVPDKNTD